MIISMSVSEIEIGAGQNVSVYFERERKVVLRQQARIRHSTQTPTHYSLLIRSAQK